MDRCRAKVRKKGEIMSTAQFIEADISNELLDRMHYNADPLADHTIAAILGEWSLPSSASPVLSVSAAVNTAIPPAAAAVEYSAQWLPEWQKLLMVNRIFEDWTDNKSLLAWSGQGSGAITEAEPTIPPEIAEPLRAYVQAAQSLPLWADINKIARAEELFMDYGALSVTLLFCSSLPECYVIPDLAEVLHTTGQLEKHTEHRIRATGAMIFPVMMRGGLTHPDGGGIAQIFKVRLIHATVRNLILRGTPESAVATLGSGQNSVGMGVIPPLPVLTAAPDMHQVLFAHGWKLGEDGLPCNQEELGYTLLTFGYVFLRSMRKLGHALSTTDEEAFLHAWNVMGYFLGIERALMPDTMAQAETLFTLMQARGRQHHDADKRRDCDQHAAVKTPKKRVDYDPRPALGAALMGAMKKVIPISVIKPFPVMLTRYLCGPATSKDLGLTGVISMLSRLLFTSFMLTVRVIDTLGRLVYPGFSIALFITRILGYRFMKQMLMDQTRPLKLPQSVKERVNTMMSHWGERVQEPVWVHSLENYLSGKNSNEAIKK